MTVLAPLRTTTWRHAVAASRAAAARAASSSTRSPSSSGAWPLPARSRANSPACGVRTPGRRSPPHQPRSWRAIGGPRHRARPAAAARRPARRAAARTSSAVARPGRRPGPTTSASCSWSRIRAERRLGVDLLDVVLGQGHRRRLDDLRREQRLERLGHGERDESRARPSGRAADEQRRAGVVERAGEDEELAERALVAALRPLRAGAREAAASSSGTAPGIGGSRSPRRSPPASRRPNPTGVGQPSPSPRSSARRAGLLVRARAGAPSGPGAAARDRRAAPRCRAGRRTGRRPSGCRTRSPPRSRTRG